MNLAGGKRADDVSSFIVLTWPMGCWVVQLLLLLLLLLVVLVAHMTRADRPVGEWKSITSGHPSSASVTNLNSYTSTSWRCRRFDMSRDWVDVLLLIITVGRSDGRTRGKFEGVTGRKALQSGSYCLYIMVAYVMTVCCDGPTITAAAAFVLKFLFSVPNFSVF